MNDSYTITNHSSTKILWISIVDENGKVKEIELCKDVPHVFQYDTQIYDVYYYEMEDL